MGFYFGVADDIGKLDSEGKIIEDLLAEWYRIIFNIKCLQSYLIS